MYNTLSGNEVFPVVSAPACFTLTPEGFFAIRDHPDFTGAVRESAAGAVRHYLSLPAMRRYYQDIGEFLVSLITTYLAFHQDGLTAGRLRSLCVSAGICSEGRANAILGYMRDRRDVIPAKQGAVGRADRLILSDRLLQAQRERVRSEIKAIARLSPLGEIADMRLDEPAYFASVILGVGRHLLETPAPVTKDTPGIRFFAERRAGLLILYHWIAENDAALCFEPFKVSISGIAARFAVSRIHVLKLLADAHERNYVIWQSDTRQLTLNPDLVASLTNFVALVFLLFGHFAAEALRHRPQG